MMPLVLMSLATRRGGVLMLVQGRRCLLMCLSQLVEVVVVGLVLMRAIPGVEGAVVIAASHSDVVLVQTASGWRRARVFVLPISTMGSTAAGVIAALVKAADNGVWFTGDDTIVVGVTASDALTAVRWTR